MSVEILVFAAEIADKCGHWHPGEQLADGRCVADCDTAAMPAGLSRQGHWTVAPQIKAFFWIVPRASLNGIV